MACSVEDCGSPARRQGLCWGHLKRKARGCSVNVLKREYGRTKEQALLDAALNLADCATDDDGAWDRARANLRMTARRYGRSAPDDGSNGEGKGGDA